MPRIFISLRKLCEWNDDLHRYPTRFASRYSSCPWVQKQIVVHLYDLWNRGWVSRGPGFAECHSLRTDGQMSKSLLSNRCSLPSLQPSKRWIALSEEASEHGWQRHRERSLKTSKRRHYWSTRSLFPITSAIFRTERSNTFSASNKSFDCAICISIYVSPRWNWVVTASLRRGPKSAIEVQLQEVRVFSLTASFRPSEQKRSSSSLRMMSKPSHNVVLTWSKMSKHLSSVTVATKNVH